MKEIKAVVFGLGVFFNDHFVEIFEEYNIVALCDNDERKHGIIVGGIKITSPDVIRFLQYDVVIITLHPDTLCDCNVMKEIVSQLESLRVPREKSMRADSLIHLANLYEE